MGYEKNPFRNFVTDVPTRSTAEFRVEIAELNRGAERLRNHPEFTIVKIFCDEGFTVSRAIATVSRMHFRPDFDPYPSLHDDFHKLRDIPPCNGLSVK